MRFTTVLLTLGLWACMAAGLPVEATAQELRGDIVGVAQDSTGAVLPGVLVTVSGPKLIQPQTMTTGERGEYRFLSLPPGDYSVTFELDGFQTVQYPDIALTLRRVLKVDATLAPAGISDLVTVVSQAPVVDVQGTAVGTSLGQDVLANIPTARDIWSTMALAPGFQMQGIDVGGSNTGSQSRFSAYGVETGHITMIEGLRSNNGRESNSAYFDYGSFEEFELGASGSMGEVAGPGALLNFTVKSGGDLFRGGAHLNRQNDSMRSDNVPAALIRGGSVDKDGFVSPPSGLKTGNNITSMYDVNPDAGGPIVPRKAWFYGSLRQQDLWRTVAGLPGVESQSRLRNVSVKSNYALDLRNTLIGYYSWREKYDPNRDISVLVPPESSVYQVGKMDLGKLEWTSVLSARLFMDLQVGLHHATNLYGNPTAKAPSSETDPVGRIELTTGQLSGANSELGFFTDSRPQYTGSLSYSPGSHLLKVGFQIHRFSAEDENVNPGDAYYRDERGVPVEVDILNTPVQFRNDNRAIGFYVQDRWNVSPHVTLNLGLRFDNYKMGWPDESYTPNRSTFFNAVSAPSQTLLRWNVAAPRLGVAWDVGGAGRSVIRAFVGRYYLDPVQTITENINPVGPASQRYEFTDRNGNRIVDPGELGRLLSTAGGAGELRLDPELQPPFGEELSLHFEREIFGGSSLRTSYVYKNLRHQDAEVDLGRVGAYTTPFVFNDPGPDDIAGTADDQVLDLFDRAPGAASDRVLTTPRAEVGTPGYDADFHTLEVAFNRRLRDRWMLMASSSYTWSDKFFLTNSRTGANEPVHHRQGFEWFPNRRSFESQTETTWSSQLTGRYESPWWGVAASSTFKFRSGYNWARRITPRLPQAGRENMPAEPVTNNRAPSTAILDLRVDKAVTFGGNGKVTLLVDVFNALNAGTVTNFVTISGPSFKQVIALLPPRAIRLGVNFRF